MLIRLNKAQKKHYFSQEIIKANNLCIGISVGGMELEIVET